MNQEELSKINEWANAYIKRCIEMAKINEIPEDWGNSVLGTEGPILPEAKKPGTNMFTFNPDEVEEKTETPTSTIKSMYNTGLDKITTRKSTVKKPTPKIIEESYEETHFYRWAPQYVQGINGTRTTMFAVIDGRDGRLVEGYQMAKTPYGRFSSYRLEGTAIPDAPVPENETEEQRNLRFRQEKIHYLKMRGWYPKDSSLVDLYFERAEKSPDQNTQITYLNLRDSMGNITTSLQVFEAYWKWQDREEAERLEMEENKKFPVNEEEEIIINVNDAAEYYAMKTMKELYGKHFNLADYEEQYAAELAMHINILKNFQRNNYA